MVKIKKQKVYSRKKKKDSLAFKRSHFNITFKFIIMIVVLGLIGLGLERIKYMFVDSDYFNVKKIDIKYINESNAGDHTTTLENVINKKILGENIFSVDLAGLKEKIEMVHPEFKEVLIRRALPNRLLVRVKRRNPVMQVKSDRFYLVDAEGVVLPNPRPFADDDLPVVIHSAASINTVKISRNNSQGLNKALLLVREAALNKKLTQYKIKTIDITDQRNISFFINMANIEIKIGDAEFGKRLDTLSALLGQLGEDIVRVKYIDLRFEDPIVGPK